MNILTNTGVIVTPMVANVVACLQRRAGLEDSSVNSVLCTLAPPWSRDPQAALEDTVHSGCQDAAKFCSQVSRASVWQSKQSGVSMVTSELCRVETGRYVDGCSWAVGAMCSGTVTLESEGMLD